MNWFKISQSVPISIGYYGNDWTIGIYFGNSPKLYMYEGVSPDEQNYIKSLLKHKNYRKVEEILRHKARKSEISKDPGYTSDYTRTEENEMLNEIDN